jgi:hypothetical protein
MNKKLFKMAKASDRELRIEAGFFDGRFAPKQYADRKKKAKKLACRKWKLDKQEY